MATVAELEARIRVLEDIEAIKRLKAKYWRCVDRKLWSELEDVFGKDATADYGPNLQFKGRKAILGFLKDSLGADSTITIHGGHNAEIEITGETSARAIWALNDIIVMQPNTKRIGWGYYEDEYVKVKGQWRKKSTKITTVLEEWPTTKQ
jgi:bile-acid 7alpha-dehydratase